MAELSKHIFLSDWKNPKIQLNSGKGFYFYDQDGNEFIDAASGAVNVSLGSVSYTHLDVYKRQPIICFKQKLRCLFKVYTNVVL